MWDEYEGNQTKLFTLSLDVKQIFTCYAGYFLNAIHYVTSMEKNIKVQNRLICVS